MALTVQPATDKEGYLVDLDDWSPAVAEWLAERERLELTAEHWALIELIRAFHKEHELSPPMRVLVRLVRQQLARIFHRPYGNRPLSVA